MSEIAIVLIGGLLVYGLLMASGIHVIHEGYVGIYKYYGVLQDKLTEPGLHFRIPFMQTYEEIQVSVQTDVVKNIPCGTSGGTLVYFDRIEVVNKLRKPFVFNTIKNYTSAYDKFWIYNKIHHEINQFCSKHTLQEIYIDEFENLDEELIKSLQIDLTNWAPGIEIISIRITKPRIPERIRANFQEMEQTKVQYMISSERQKVTQQQELTKQKQAMIQALSKLDVKVIELDKEIKLRENDLKLAIIEAQIFYERAKAETDAKHLAAIKEVELAPRLYTSEYLSFKGVSAFTENVTMVLGESIPNIVSGLKL